MPEIKHNFTGGKMNKDLDERIIPKGQYFDAMNIQVSTSEGSNVGTAQNILGNSMVPGQGFISDDAVCVGSIADEKNDKLYWFVINYGNEEYVTNGEFTGSANGWSAGRVDLAGTPLSPLPSNGWSYSWSDVTATNVGQYDHLVTSASIKEGKTYVIKCHVSNFTGYGDLTPVIVDQSGYWTRPGNAGSTTVAERGGGDGEGWWSWTLRASVWPFEGQETPYVIPGWGPYNPNLLYFQNR